jgi:hypothetical protein
VTLRIVVDAATEPAASFARYQERISAMHRHGAERMIQRAVDRGELPADFSGQPFYETLYGAVLMHALAMTPDEREQARQHVTEHVTPLVGLALASVHARITQPG